MALRSFFCCFFLLLTIASTSYSLPFVFFHGLEDECTSNNTKHVVSFLKANASVEGQCIEIGDGRHDSVYMPMIDQINIACTQVKKLEYLKDGFNLFSMSQGTLIGRGVIEFCDGAPPVRNFISLAGPHAGVAAIPFCKQIFGACCPAFQKVLDKAVYINEIQNLMAPATYYKLPNKIEEYLKISKFLPKLNNEHPGERNSTYKERFSSLNQLVLLANEEEDALIPKETTWFGYYKDGTTNVQPVQETALYIEDWIGLRSLDERGKVIFQQVPGTHADARDSTLTDFVVPFLKDEQPLRLSLSHGRRWTKTKQLLHNKA